MAGMRPLLITGVPGVGKTTLFKQLLKEVSGKVGSSSVRGFYVDEERPSGGGGRVGFNLVTIPDGRTARLARLAKDDPNPALPKVGRWCVYVNDLEHTALPVVSEVAHAASQDGAPLSVLMVDEIGKMELLSAEFRTLLGRLLARPPPNLYIICIIALKGQGLVGEAKRLPNVDVVEVTAANRDSVYKSLAAHAARELKL
eukprot:TRINITY_DN21285_c0_g1_i1.p1 TRINITY_DN21285_c0_g1~~TRINITY_DN21285_c0_g1_i1.p1  ORF type:complete len:216 (+),score=70.18 TRINITY_DN21285_c0_g1_i1:50-649(+)